MRRARRAWGFAAIGFAANAVALVAALPARFVVDPGAGWDVAGTVWNGEAVLGGAYRLAWRWAPLRSLAALSFAADVRLTGAGTDIAGSAIRGWGRTRFDGLSGSADGALAAALAPGLPFACDVGLQIDLPRLVLDGAASSAVGEIRSGSGSCGLVGEAGSVAVPPLLATMRTGVGGSTVAQVAPVGQARLHWVDGAIAGGRLVVTVTPAGGAALPFARGLRVDRAL